MAADTVGSLSYRLDRRSRKGDLQRDYVSDEIKKTNAADEQHNEDQVAAKQDI